MNNKTKSNQKAKEKSFIIIVVFSLIIGIALGYLLGYLTISINKTINKGPERKSQSYSEERSGGYQFTNPLLDCDNFQPSLLKSHVNLIKNLKEYVNTTLKMGDVSHISVYFRSMNDGPWIGINEDYFYAPASLLKVPIMIALLKRTEIEPSLLKKKIKFSTPTDTTCKPNIGDNERLKIGNTYTVDELLDYMIDHSDNEAKEILTHLLGEDYIMNVMTDCGVNLKNRDLSIDFLTVKEYSSFYRILYNASYLNREMSEKALELLSKTKFDEGIPKKLPKDIKISHKFGERGYANSNLKQLHDCGIVYIPDSPYLLCVMTKGNNFDILYKVISDISEIVYKSAIEK